MATIPAAGYFTNGALTQAGLKLGYDDLIASLRQLAWAGQVELTSTIVSGVIVPAGSGGVVVVDTEASAATDDLTNITPTNYPDGSFLLMRNSNASRVVTVKHAAGGSGAVQLDRGVDYVLDDTKKWLLAIRIGDAWIELLRGPQRMTGATSTQAAAFTVAMDDLGQTFLCTGTYTVSLTAAASLGAGFLVGIRNVGSGTITVDPNASELIDNATTLLIQPGWSHVLLCTGTAWVSVGVDEPRTSHRSVWFNGTFEVWQRGTSLAHTLGAGSLAYLPADRWVMSALGSTFSFTINRSTVVPTLAQVGVLLNYALEVDCTTAYASPAAADALSLMHRCATSTMMYYKRTGVGFTVSFWVKSSKTGTHSISCYDQPYSCVMPYTVSVADTWEKKVVTFPQITLTGGASFPGLEATDIRWNLLCGTTSATSSTGTWLSGNYHAVTGSVNVMDNTANFFRIAGVQIDRGPYAMPYQLKSFLRDYDRARLWFSKSFQYGTAHAQNVGANTGEFIFPSPVGASTLFDCVFIPIQVPHKGGWACFLYNPEALSGEVRNRTRNENCSSTVAASTNGKGIQLRATTSVNTQVGDTMAIHWIAT